METVPEIDDIPLETDHMDDHKDGLKDD